MADQLVFASASGSAIKGIEEKGEAKRHQLLTRTIAILAGVACSTHQPAIQAQIKQGGFTILSERSELWSLETDQDFLQEFLRDEEKQTTWMRRLTGAKIHVMVLERHDAAEAWLRLCGPDLEGDEEVLDEDGLPLARVGLRARYGTGVLYGSVEASAPRQLAICFPDLASVAALDKLHAETEMLQSFAAMSTSGSSVLPEDDHDNHGGQTLGSRLDPVVHQGGPSAAGKADEYAFKARPMPSSTKQPTIKPRLSKAAALRMGVEVPEAPKRAMSTATPNEASLGISGVPRADVALPKVRSHQRRTGASCTNPLLPCPWQSLQAPTIAPRLNRAASVRTKTDSSSEADTAVKTRKPIDFSNTPGHKRASLSSCRPASLAAPVVAPRLNKAASARLSSINGNEADKGSHLGSSVSSAQSSSPPASVATRKAIDFSNTPGHKRMSLTTSSIKSLQAPTLAPRANLASQARTSVGAPTGGIRADDVVNRRQSISRANDDNGKENQARKPVDFSNTPGHKRPSSGFAISSLAQPTIVPRSNAAATKRLSMGGVAPSSFKGIPPVQPQSTRPVSMGGSASKLLSASLRSARLASRGSMPAAHQDGAFPRSAMRAAAPPSSFRV